MMTTLGETLSHFQNKQETGPLIEKMLISWESHTSLKCILVILQDNLSMMKYARSTRRFKVRALEGWKDRIAWLSIVNRFVGMAKRYLSRQPSYR